MIKIADNSKENIYSSNMELIDNFTEYSSKNLDFDKPVEIDFLDNEDNAKNPLGTTAHYNPDEMKITIYVTGRHLKDILRSISHELIHHVQNCRGDFNGMEDTGLGYAQKDKHMRGMEHEAYTAGNIMNFRDFEDNYKKENKQMKTSLKELKKIINEETQAVIAEQQTLGDIYEPVKSKIMDADDLNLLARFIVDKADDTNLSQLELTTIFQGIKSAEKKGMLDNLKNILMKRTKKQTSGFAKGRFVPVYTPANDYKGDIVKGLSDTFFSAPRDRKKRNAIVRILSIAPAGAKPVDSGSIEQSVKAIMDLYKSQGKEVSPAQAKKIATSPKGKKLLSKATTASPTPRRTKRKCPKLPLRRGCTGELVKNIQKLLILVGYGRQLGKTGADGDGADGDYGGRTVRAVKEFQKAQIKAGNLPAKNKRGRSNVDGVAGKLTVQALKNLAKDMKAKPASVSPKDKPKPPPQAPPRTGPGRPLERPGVAVPPMSE